MLKLRKHGAHGRLRAYLHRNNSSMSIDKTGLSKELADKVRYFVQDTSPGRVSKNLRVVFFDYLRNQREGLPMEFDQILDDMQNLFEFLDVAAEERKPQ